MSYYRLRCVLVLQNRCGYSPNSMNEAYSHIINAMISEPETLRNIFLLELGMGLQF